ncbi:transposase-like protein [Corynebacterium diphtheriae]|nr:hypothetical protein CDIPH_10255 [Corynebacterium diphtheriae]CAB1052197.1 hypothetical protein NCTC11397BIS_02125 [Corynebacterium diphtheriae]CKH17328.1 transposase-like protein [Corynebacterium diphtheriae]
MVRHARRRRLCYSGCCCGRSGSTEPPFGGSSKDFSPNFTPNRFQTGRLSRFGVKCRLFGGERGWRAHQRPPVPTNASQSQPGHGYGKRPTPRSAQPTGPIFVSRKGAESQAAGAADTAESQPAGNLAHELIHLVKDLWRSTLDPRHRLANHEVVDRAGYKNAQCAAGHDR